MVALCGLQPGFAAGRDLVPWKVIDSSPSSSERGAHSKKIALSTEILDDWDLWIDARDFFYTGHWTTPQFSPVRFKTRFFMAVCPPKST